MLAPRSRPGERTTTPNAPTHASAGRPRRVRRNLHTATGPDAAQPAKLRASPRCPTRPNRQKSNSESRSRWIKVGGNGAVSEGGLFGMVLGGAVGSRRVARLVSGRHVGGLWLEARHRGSGLDQRAIHREVVVRQERRHLAAGQDRGQHLARHLGRQQPIAVLAEHGGPSARGFARSGLN